MNDLEAARVRMQEVRRDRARRLVSPYPPPRYDDVFVQGTAALDADGSESISAPLRPSAPRLWLRAAGYLLMLLMHVMDVFRWARHKCKA